MTENLKKIKKNRMKRTGEEMFLHTTMNIYLLTIEKIEIQN